MGEAAAHRPDDPSVRDRDRYRELLEELRTILPGVQVLFAFLLTAPFSARFGDLDEYGRDLYTVALIGTAVAMVVFLAPASHHRVARNNDRSDRVRTAVVLMVVGMLCLAGSVVTVVFVVLRFIFGAGVGVAVAGSLGGLLLLLWYVLPAVQARGTSPTLRAVRGDEG